MISNEVLSDPQSPFVNSLCRIFGLLDLNPIQAQNIRDLEVLTANMINVSREKKFVALLLKINGLRKSGVCFLNRSSHFLLG